MTDISAYVDTAAITQEVANRKREGVIPIFYMRSVEDVERSNKTGKRIFKEVPFLKIIIPGDRDIVDRRVLGPDKDRFPQHWAAFKAKREMPTPEGFPIEQWAGCTRAEHDTLEASNITTLEQLAEVSDENLKTIGHEYVSLKYKASKFLESIEDQESINKVVSELDRLKKKYKSLKDSHEELKAKSDEVFAENKLLKAGKNAKTTK